MFLCEELLKVICSYLTPLDAIKLALCSKYIYNIVKKINYDEYINIDINFKYDNIKNMHNILDNIKCWKNMNFRICIPELNNFDKLSIFLPSYDNLYYYFEGDYTISTDYINNNEVIINNLLPKNILYLKPRQLTHINDVTLFTSLFKNVERINMLYLNDWRCITDLSFLQNIKIEQLIFTNAVNITSLDPIKNCGIKELNLYNFNIDIFDDENIFNILRKFDNIEFLPSYESWNRAHPSIKNRWKIIMKLPNVCITR